MAIQQLRALRGNLPPAPTQGLGGVPELAQSLGQATKTELIKQTSKNLLENIPGVSGKVLSAAGAAAVIVATLFNKDA